MDKLTVNLGRRTLYVSTSSIIKSTKSEKGLSRTIPAIEGSSTPYIKLQIAISTVNYNSNPEAWKLKCSSLEDKFISGILRIIDSKHSE